MDAIFRIMIYVRHERATPDEDGLMFSIESVDEFTVSCIALDGYMLQFTIDKWQRRFPESKVWAKVSVI